MSKMKNMIQNVISIFTPIGKKNDKFKIDGIRFQQFSEKERTSYVNSINQLNSMNIFQLFLFEKFSFFCQKIKKFKKPCLIND